MLPWRSSLFHHRQQKPPLSRCIDTANPIHLRYKDLWIVILNSQPLKMIYTTSETCDFNGKKA
jgi:hypothetical protein